MIRIAFTQATCFTILGLCQFMPASAFTFSADSATTVLTHLYRSASARSELADAKLQRSLYRLDALNQLFNEGHVSFKELTDAKLQHSVLSAQRNADKELLRFIDDLKDASRQASHRLAGSSDREFVSIVMTSLASDPRTRLLSTLDLQFPGTLGDDEVSNGTVSTIQALEERRRMLAEEKFDARFNAWEQLIEKLKLIDDGSESIKREITLHQFDQRIATARTKVSEITERSMVFCMPTHRFRYKDHFIATNDELSALVHCEAKRLHAAAIAETSREQELLLAELARRVEQAVVQDASPTDELPVLERRIAQLNLQHAFAKDLASVSDDGPTYTLVSQARDSSSTRSTAKIPLLQLQDAYDATVERLFDAADRAEWTEVRSHQLSEKSSRIDQLAARDPFFAREAEAARLHADLATAQAKHAAFEHHLRVLENEYAAAVLVAREAIAVAVTEDRLSWRETLRKWFQLNATSTTSHELATQQIRLDKWRLTAIENLYQTGDASWKELTAAQVRCEETRWDIKQADVLKKQFTMIHQLLKESHQIPVSLAIQQTHSFASE